ncbi:hypothetical protein C7476_119100 [Phyllobacterium bourgognense]|uniref:Uncharacterized protein n=1 Tax=Phyllobacterium bourgognense TaxID=314236 RepID=A0A368YHQ3_9HYPH|nr:hypothetical protein C7476_119100 [Phyllobacterium bourgognense]
MASAEVVNSLTWIPIAQTMFRAELLIFGEVKNDTSEEVKSACQIRLSEIGSVRH